MLRVGIVGCGFIGGVHSWALWALRRAGLVDAAVVAVHDHLTERAVQVADVHDATVAGDLSELLDAVDVVYVCTPTAEHLKVVEPAAERGVAIFCEKPLGPDLAGAERLATAIERVPHRVGLVLRAAPVFRRIREILAAQRYGRTLAVHLRDDQFFPIQGHYASTWRAQVDVAGGGTLIEHSIHDLDLFRWLLGDPAEVTCRTTSFFGHPGIEDLAMATLVYPDGLVAGLTSVWHQVMSRGSSRRLEVFCERALLWTDDDYTGPLHIETSEGLDAVDCQPAAWVDELPVPDAVRRPLGQYAEPSKTFLDGLAAGVSSGPGAAEALAGHHLVDDCYRSAREGGIPVAT